MEAVEDVALPDPLAFAGADQPTFNSGGREKVGIALDLCLAFWEVAAD